MILEISLSKKELIVLLLIYCAHLDFKFTNQEKDYIKSKSTLDIFTRMHQLYNEHKMSEIQGLILSNFLTSFSLSDTKGFLLDDLRGLYIADGEFCRFEQSFDRFFRTYLMAI